MNSNEGQPAGTDTQDNYEATVLDFLDKEMATVQEAQKKNQQSDELDELVTDLLKQVITEADQTQDADKPLFDEDELFAGLPASPQAAAPVEGTDRDSVVDQPSDSVQSFSSASTVKKTEEINESVPMPEPPEISKIQASPAVVFRPAIAPRKKIPVTPAVAAGLILIIAASLYFFSGSSGKTRNSAGSHATAAQTAKVDMPTPAATNLVKPATAPMPTKSASPTAAKPSPGAAAQKQAPGKAAAAPASQTTQQPAVQQPGKPALTHSQSEPGPAATAKGPAEERTVMAQSAPVTPLSAPIAATIEKPAAPPAADHSAPVTPSNPDRKPTPPPQPVNAVSETQAPAAQPALSTPPVNNLTLAVPTMQTSPVYPEVALRSRTTGSVVLELQIDDQGKVVKATPVSGPAIFYSAAVNAAMKWRYKPASIGGVNVSSQSRVTMNFNLKK